MNDTIYELNVDLFNYYAIYFLELFGNHSPKQSEIDRIDTVLKKLCEQYIKTLLKALRVS